MGGFYYEQKAALELEARNFARASVTPQSKVCFLAEHSRSFSRSRSGRFVLCCHRLYVRCSSCPRTLKSTKNTSQVRSVHASAGKSLSVNTIYFLISCISFVFFLASHAAAVDHVAILGVGDMGVQLAYVTATKGTHVYLYDQDQATLDAGLKRIQRYFQGKRK